MPAPRDPSVIPLHTIIRGVHPGHVIRDYLSRWRLTQTVAADMLGMSRHNLNMIISGRRAVTAETAIALDGVFGTPPNYWLTIQNHYDTHRATARAKRAAAKAK